MRKNTFCLAGIPLGALVLAFGVAGGALSNSGTPRDTVGKNATVERADPYRDVEATPDMAVAAVKAIVRTPGSGEKAALERSSVATDDLAAKGPIDGATYRYYEVMGRDVYATVDVHDGRVAQLLLLRSLATSSTACCIGVEEAQSMASSYLTSHGISTKGLAMSAAKEDHGDTQTYVVSWQMMVNDAEVPDYRMVELDAVTASYSGCTTCGVRTRPHRRRW
jgi:hypothetical protein